MWHGLTPGASVLSDGPTCGSGVVVACEHATARPRRDSQIGLGDGMESHRLSEVIVVTEQARVTLLHSNLPRRGNWAIPTQAAESRSARMRRASAGVATLRTCRWTMAAPARAALTADRAICSGVTG